jgi:TolB-like protein/tetratricopeptide (TPR) repeat protein/predicted Ser/Thr protein kinase
MPLDRERIAHYRVLKMAASGGMGEVYEAEDERLNRKVALKVISAPDPEMRRRFLREAHAASALTHPNVAHIYEIGNEDGIDYIAMEYIEGETLAQRIARGTMTIDEIVDISRQLADALAAAHERSIIHRDIKPSNMMLTPRGQLKVLDFGLAKIQSASDEKDSTLRLTATQPGAMVGTIGYMSPEQALGEPVDTASDVFSVGVVLYEMIAGRMPFAGRTAADTLHRITSTEPEPLARFNYDLPTELERIVRKCLQKTRTHRYRSAHELLLDLNALSRDRSSPRAASWAVGTRRRIRRGVLVLVLVIAVLGTGAWMLKGRVPGRGVRSVAVLPFSSAGEPDIDYVTDGLTDALINDLAENGSIRVMARSTVFRFKRSRLTPQQVGRELNVDAVVAADMRRRGDRFDVAAELVSVDDGARLWGAHYERQSADLMTIQQDLAKDVSRALHLDRAVRAGAAATADRAAAHQLYLRGQYAMNQRTMASIGAAAEDFRHAVAVDPTYAPPYAALADTFTLAPRYTNVPTGAIATKARQAARKALQLDPSLPEGHVSLGSVYDTCDWNWSAAEQSYRRAIALRPGDVLAHQWYALLLARLGRRDEAREQIQAALRLDPLSSVLNTAAANVYYYARQYDEAAAYCAKAITLDPARELPHVQMAVILIAQGRRDEAKGELAKGGASSVALAGRAVVDARMAEEAIAQLEERKAFYESAVVAASIGRIDEALQSLERAVAARSVYASYANVEPLLDPLRGDARFIAQMRAAGLQR